MPVKETYECCQCGEILPVTDFYRSASSMYSAIGHLPICKRCLLREYKRYKIDYMNREQAMQRVCMAFDIYFNRTIFESGSGNDDTLLGNYLRKINLGQYKNKTFDNTIEEGFNIPTVDTGDTRPDESKPTKTGSGENHSVDQRLIDKWGDGLSYIDYQELEKHHKYLKDANPNCDSNQDIFITDLCYTKMQQMKAIRDGDVDAYNKLTDSYRKSFQQAGLKTVKESNVSDSFTMGVTIDTIEKFTPAEYYKDKKLYRDFDGIGEYIERFMLRPLRNLMHGTSDRDSEFYVKDDGDADEFDE